MAKKTGWFADPAGRHRLRYRDGGWTAWVFDAQGTTVDSAGAEFIDRRRRRRIVVGIIAALAGTLFLAGCLAFVDQALRGEELRGVDEAIAEMDTWRLPPDVQQAERADRVQRGSIGAYGPSVTRWYVPASGRSPADALQDFARSLEHRGYDLVPSSEESLASSEPTWAGTLKFSKYADFTVGLDPDGHRIQVVVRPD